ncbi:hypothetical protein MKZ38_009695 [Zalerion maritima]|uniref:Uncharacterized protein n=1 Tax=Zalerion maritima TaxID=339359 RepID=A0AAD5WM04_9PEZI|nr:hypothetical protein MKZ38_009695 [Zalerion maritima]
MQGIILTAAIPPFPPPVYAAVGDSPSHRKRVEEKPPNHPYRCHDAANSSNTDNLCRRGKSRLQAEVLYPRAVPPPVPHTPAVPHHHRNGLARRASLPSSAGQRGVSSSQRARLPSISQDPPDQKKPDERICSFQHFRHLPLSAHPSHPDP